MLVGGRLKPGAPPLPPHMEKYGSYNNYKFQTAKNDKERIKFLFEKIQKLEEEVETLKWKL